MSTRRLRKEFTFLDDHHCVRDGLVGIHSTALTDTDFRHWHAQGGGAVVWSPFSNLWLYGDTTDIVSARRHGLRVCLGSDWTPSGTRNVLGELKVATRWNRVALDGELEPEDLVELVTANPGDTLAGPWGVPVGRLVEGGLADLACFTQVRDDPWRTVLAATERHVQLVIVGGRPIYGNKTLLERAGVTGAEPITVAGVKRAVVMDLPEDAAADRARPPRRSDEVVAARACRSSTPSGRTPARPCARRATRARSASNRCSSFPTSPVRTAAKHVR